MVRSGSFRPLVWAWQIASVPNTVYVMMVAWRWLTPRLFGWRWRMERSGRQGVFCRRRTNFFESVFLWPFYRSLCGVWVGQRNYQYAFVSGPDTDYLWLLSRTPEVAPEVMEKFKRCLKNVASILMNWLRWAPIAKGRTQGHSSQNQQSTRKAAYRVMMALTYWWQPSLGWVFYFDSRLSSVSQ